MTFEEYTRHIDWSLTVGRRRTRQASTVRELEGAPALLAALDDERAGSGEIRNARAVICLAEGDPAAALAAVAGVLDGTAPVIGYATVVEAQRSPDSGDPGSAARP